MYDQECLGKLREFIRDVVAYYASAGGHRSGPVVLTEQMAHLVLKDYQPADIRHCLIELAARKEIEILDSDPIRFVADKDSGRQAS